MSELNLMSQINPAFAPWRKGLLGGSCLVAVGTTTFLLSAKAPLFFPGLAIGAALTALGGMWFKSGLVRWNGKRVEQSSIRSLRLPEGWTASSNLVVPGGGDVDLLITTSTFRKFAVEIKSQERVRIRRALFGLGRTAIVNGAGKDLGRPAIQQAISSASAVNAEPVLWYPAADEAVALQISGVLVVAGNAKRLVKALASQPAFR